MNEFKVNKNTLIKSLLGLVISDVIKQKVLSCKSCKDAEKIIEEWVDKNLTGERDNNIPHTEEEWLRSADSEEMAGTIYEWYSQGHIEGKVGKQLSSVTRVVEWLKEKKHDEM